MVTMDDKVQVYYGRNAPNLTKKSHNVQICSIATLFPYRVIKLRSNTQFIRRHGGRSDLAVG